MEAALEQLDDEDIWIEAPFSKDNDLHVELRALDQSLRCPVCADILEIPTCVVNCHHTFCAACIRKSLTPDLKKLKRTSQCPICKQVVDPDPTFKKSTYINKTLSIAVAHYKALRKALHLTLKKSLEEKKEEPSKKKEATSSSTRRSQRGRKRQNYDEIMEDSDDSMEVPQVEKVVIRKNKLKPKPLPVGKKNRKQLVVICERYGISCQGSEKELADRLKAFVQFFNAQLDSVTPYTEKQLVNMFNQQQREWERGMQQVDNGQKSEMARFKRLQQNGDSTGRPRDGDLKGFDALLKKGREMMKHKGPKDTKRAWNEENPVPDAEPPLKVKTPTPPAKRQRTSLNDWKTPATDSKMPDQKPTSKSVESVNVRDVKPATKPAPSIASTSTLGLPDPRTHDYSSSPSCTVPVTSTRTNPYTLVESSTRMSAATCSSIGSGQTHGTPAAASCASTEQSPDSVVDLTAAAPKTKQLRKKEWACQVCTFLNKTSKSICEVCGSFNKK